MTTQSFPTPSHIHFSHRERILSRGGKAASEFMKPSGQGDALLFPHLSEVFLSLPRRENKPVFFWSIIDLQNFRYTEKWLGGPWSIKWSKQRLTEFCQENELVIANTLFQQHKRRLHMDITRWSILKSDWLHSLQPKMEKSYTVSKNTTRSRLWLRSWTPYCQIQTYKLKKTGKTTRPFKYDWNPLQLYRESDK